MLPAPAGATSVNGVVTFAEPTCVCAPAGFVKVSDERRRASGDGVAADIDLDDLARLCTRGGREREQ